MEIMLKKFSSQKSEAEIIKEAMSPPYDGANIQSFLPRAEKAYNQAKFNDLAKFGLLRETMKYDQLLLQVVPFRGAKYYEELKKCCADYADNQKMMSNPVGPQCHETMNKNISGKNIQRYSTWSPKERSEKAPFSCVKIIS